MQNLNDVSLAKPDTNLPTGVDKGVFDFLPEAKPNEAAPATLAPAATPAEQKPVTQQAEATTPVAEKAAETTQTTDKPTEAAAETTVTETSKADDTAWLSKASGTKEVAVTDKTTPTTPVAAPGEHEDLVRLVTGDPTLNAIVTAIKAGAPVLEAISKFQKKDFSSLKGAELISAVAKDEGLSEEEVEQELEHYNALSPLAKKEYDRTFQNKLNDASNKQISQVAEEYTRKLHEQEQQKRAFTERAVSEIESIATTMVGQTYDGEKISSEDAEDYRAFMTSLHQPRADGSYDTMRPFRWWWAERKGHKITQNTAKAALSQGREEVLDSVTRVNENSVATKIPSKTPVDPKQHVMESLDAYAQGIPRPKF